MVESVINWDEEEDLPTLVSDDWFNISGRGRVAVVTFETEDEVPKIGDHVRIDGDKYEVRGVERQGRQLKVGLLARELS